VKHLANLGALIALVAAAPAARAQAPASPADTAAPAIQEIVVIRVGQTRSGILEAGDHTMGDGTWADIWHIEATAGQRIVVELRSRQFDAYMQLLDPWGGMIAEDDDSAGGNDARITYQVREAGRLQIIVNTFGDTRATGAYTIDVR
jgi:hypothetical protein